MRNSESDAFDGFEEAGPAKYLKPKDFVGPIMAREDQADRRHLRWAKTVVTISMTLVVALMNWMVINMLSSVVYQEMSMISMGTLPAEYRTVTTNVYLALIGGTVAEVSALFFIIVKSMFKNGAGNEPRDNTATGNDSTKD
ncbi:hypothetical protein [Chimaeribacter arupi]|uniref:Uncharacterized protein n=1 Tax=Chimaeribacter arupi TaxID=2060066 RepID=A0A2N5EH44_9GAMM|nr:hypothetical protein [Chimaeribacter arupi]PLR42688.1 hypothetical protein CYR34_21315 [Chimaeribacter arupi]